MSPFQSPPMSPCSSCKMIPNNDCLYRVHISSWTEAKEFDGTFWSSGVCNQCLVKKHLPVFRPSNNKWEFGKVLAYDAASECHRIVFTDDTKEWVVVPRDPMSDYIHQFVSEEYSNPSFSLSTVDSFSILEEFEEPELDTKPPAQPSFDAERSQVTMISSNLTTGRSSPPKLKDPPKSLSPDRLFTPVAPKQHLNDVRGTISFGTPNSQISALSAGTLLSTKTLSPAASLLPLNSSTLSAFSKAKQQGFSPKHGTIGAASAKGISSVTSPSKSTVSSTSSNRSKASQSCTKKTLRLWTTEEDKALMDAIKFHEFNMVWTKIATAVPGRTGKQCRERYLNHLTPAVKLSSWSVTEDATIFRLYKVEGSKWSRMVKFLPGRTDNGIKNRFHYLRRRFERRMQPVRLSEPLVELMNKIQNSRLFCGTSLDPLFLKYLALRMLEDKHKRNQKTIMTSEYKFGPYHPVHEQEGCERCGLMMPSLQTGRYICSTTGWCQTCCGLSPLVTDDALRIGHVLESENTPV